MATLVSLGHIVMTVNLKRTLEEINSVGNGAGNVMEELEGLIDRHVSGDWGYLVREDWDLNQQALETGDTSSHSAPPARASNSTSSPRPTVA